MQITSWLGPRMHNAMKKGTDFILEDTDLD